MAEVTIRTHYLFGLIKKTKKEQLPLGRHLLYEKGGDTSLDGIFRTPVVSETLIINEDEISLEQISTLEAVAHVGIGRPFVKPLEPGDSVTVYGALFKATRVYTRTK